MTKLLLVLHTIRYLKPLQIRYQLWYRLRYFWRTLIGFNYQLSIQKEGYPIKLNPFIPKYPSFTDYQFTFLNQSKVFSRNDIDWNYNVFGKLWTYNLNYFDFLLQPEIMPEIGQALIEDFIPKLYKNFNALEPYTIALRGINWIKFLTVVANGAKQPTQISTINSSLYSQYQILIDNIEYHLLGNHLLEDGFSLLFGAFYFREEKLYLKAVEIIKQELNEQILNDGAHFELSPMYHQIILDRLLDCINLVQNNQRFRDQENLLDGMKCKAVKMIHWLNAITFRNGEIPLLNDATKGIAPTSQELMIYATQLGILKENAIDEIHTIPYNLKESGYRRYNGINYECILDIGQIGPSYQPGHAHADTFNFVLNVNNQAYIVDTGISVYEVGQTRLKERGTASHNTVTIGNWNSSGIWSSFRVAHRAKVHIIYENEKTVIAEHEGYHRKGITHQRKWEFQEKQIQITDTLKGKNTEGKAHLWLSPLFYPEIKENRIYLENTILTFENSGNVSLIKNLIPVGYNKYNESYKIEITFNGHLTTKISTN